MAKIGLAITTKGRPEYLAKCLSQMAPKADFLCIVNDGTPYDSKVYENAKMPATIVQHGRTLGVACAKNTALRTLIQNGCDLLFVMADDVILKDEFIFSRYITAAQASGIWHLNCGYTNKCNLEGEETHTFKEIIEYAPNVSLVFTQDLDGSFQFFHKGLLQMVGYMDERYSKFCMMEHVDHSYKMVKAGILPGYWWWPDIEDSWKYIETLPESLEDKNSTIRSLPDYDENIKKANSLFLAKYGVSPYGVPSASKEDILKRLEEIQKTYALNQEPT